MTEREAIEILHTAVGCCSSDIKYNALEKLISALPKHGHWIEVDNPSYSPFDGSGEHLYVCSRCFMTHPRKSVFCGCCGTQLIETETDDDEFEIKTYVKGKKDIPSDEEVKYTYKKIKEDINAKTRD